MRVAVVGAGPAGFYAAEALLKRDDLRVEVDLFERLPAPYGLVRYGVAPDHQKIKRVADVYDRIAELDGFRLLANVQVGHDVTHAELLQHYHQVLYTVGCEVSRMLGIPGEDRAGVYGATSFVNWYNGHPDFRDLDVQLDAERAVVVGIGDVAMDVTRLLVQNPDDLARTDVADYAMDVFRASRVREVVMLARRGPAQSAFAVKELRDIADLDGVDVVVDPACIEHDLAELDSMPSAVRKKVEYLAELAERPRTPGAKRVGFRFLRSPIEVLGDGRMSGIRLEENELVRGRDGDMRARGTGHHEDLEAGLLIRSIGYRGVPIEGVPFDHHTGRIPNVDGRVTVDDWGRHLLPRTYVAGWIKRGPSGLVGANKSCAHGSVEHMIEDIEGKAPSRWRALEPREAIDTLLEERGVRVVSFDDWKRVDAHELELGEAHGKLREKLTRVSEVLELLDGPADRAAAGS